MLKTQNGTPVRVRDIGDREQGPKIRLGQIGKAIHRERRQSDRQSTTWSPASSCCARARTRIRCSTALHEKVDFLNDHILPPGVKIVPHLDRSDLVHLTTHTVLHNLTEGILLVSVILFIFLGNLRGALIVTLTIPFSLLFASICLDLRHIPANLLSLGALDFGMVVEGAVVMIENIVRHAVAAAGSANKTRHRRRSRARPTKCSGRCSIRIAIIITAYLPIFTLQRVEGRLFRPMAWTVAFALLGALISRCSLAPVLAQSAVSAKARRNGTTRCMDFLTRSLHDVGCDWPSGCRWVTVGMAAGAALASACICWRAAIGSEFLPHLDEGAIWARGTLAPSTGPTEGDRVMNQARVIFARFPEVTQVVSQVGRPDDGTDTTGFFNTEYFIDLKPKEQWRPRVPSGQRRADRGHGPRARTRFPASLWNFSQPIADNMEEAVSGVKGELAIKIYGTI